MNSAATLHLDFGQAIEPPVRHAPRSWRGFAVEQVVLETPEAYDFRAVGDLHYLALHDMTLADGELMVDGLAPIARTDLRDTMTFAPKGCAIEGWAKPSLRRNSYTAFYFDPQEVSEDLDARYADAQVKPFAYARNPALASTMTKLGKVAVGGGDELYAETLCLAAALEILGVKPPDEAGKLSPTQLEKVYGYVAEHLGEPITLDDLAGLSGLSRSHFSRAFKATTGIGPHRFVNSQRIARARDLLSQSESIDAVARAVGFTSASVFRRVFQQTMGVTPQRFRKDGR